MILLVLFAFLAGFVTILSPCILPILPIVLSGSITGGHRRPLGIVTGFVISFTIFTLFLASIVRLTGVPADFLRSFSVVIILLFGISLLVPGFQAFSERLFSKIASRFSGNSQNKTGFFGGVLLGISLGLVWTPCVGPIIASVITLAATDSVTGGSVLITLSYSLGTAIPMFAITYGGRALLQKVPWLLRNTSRIQKGFGLLMILVALAIFFNLDRKFQTIVLDKFPQYGVGLTSLEDNDAVKKELQKVSTQPSLGESVNDAMYPTAPEIIAGGEWFNSPALTLTSLRGKVVLIDFWTYTCINCIRTLPYLKDWYSKYEDEGFVIIGVHTPEFEFEKKAQNVENAISDFGIKYPVVQDNEYATWQAYANRYWPAHYLIDKNGKVRYTHFGEGEYDITEGMIQKLLKEAGAAVTDPIQNSSEPNEALTHETYLGYLRMEGYSSPEELEKDQKQSYSIPAKLPSNAFAFEGNWTVNAESASADVGSALEFNFNSRDVFLVMNPTSKSAIVQVWLDGKEYKQLKVDTNKLYELVKLEKGGAHRLRIKVVEGSISAFAFTFG